MKRSKHLIKIGITGGIGSGKSTVCQLFRVHGIPVFCADTEAKKLNDSSPVICEQLSLLFGSDLYKDNCLNRQKLASIIFSNPTYLQQVNAIIHPEVAKLFEEWANQQKNAPFVIIDAPVLFEAGFDALVDKTITVYASKETRLERIEKRDNINAAQIEARMNSQLPENEKMQRSNFVIMNDNRTSLIAQIAALMDEISCEVVLKF